MSDEDRDLFEKHKNDLKQFHENIETQWETLACKMECDVDTAKEIYAHYDHEHSVGPLP